eukprot:gene30876-38159_t
MPTVVTGPVYAPLFINHEWVHVIIARKKTAGGKDVYAVGAFMVPNANSISSKTPLSNFIVRLDQLEGIAGHRAWEDYLTDKEVLRLDEVVPDERDLAVTLSAKNILCADTVTSTSSSTTSIVSGSKDTKSLALRDIINPMEATSPDVVYINSRYTQITQLSNKQVTAVVASSGLKKSKQSNLLRENGSGPIPDCILELTSLQELKLNNNKLSGDIPRGWDKLTALK